MGWGGSGGAGYLFLSHRKLIDSKRKCSLAKRVLSCLVCMPYVFHVSSSNVIHKFPLRTMYFSELLKACVGCLSTAADLL